MPGWRGICDFARDIRELVRGDWLFMWFLAPVTGTLLALILWLSWLSDVVLAITGSERWGMLTNTPEGLAIIAGFAALTAGHMLNAWMTRRRDDRLREQEKCALAAALSAEFDVLGNGIMILRAQITRQHEYGEAAPVALWKPPTEIFKNNTERLGLLGARMARHVTNVSELARIVSDSVIINWSDLSTDPDLAEGMKKKTYELANEAKTISIQLELIAGGDDVDAVLNTLTPDVTSQMQADSDHLTDTESAGAEPDDA